MITFTLLLLLAAFVLSIASAMNRVPLWISVLVLTLAVATMAYPGRL